MPWDLVKLNDGKEVGTGRPAYDLKSGTICGVGNAIPSIGQVF
jgi:hypothetical protein